MHPDQPSVTAEGGGFVLDCADCGLTRFYAVRAQADAGRREHIAKCKGPKVKPEATPRRAPAASWDDREGATWIDSL
jgi:hypothetical protein